MKKLIPFPMLLILTVTLTAFIISCTDSESPTSNKTAVGPEMKYYDGKGIGPITQVALSDSIDPMMVKSGEAVFTSKCVTCHQLDGERKIGPGMAGVTKRRRPEWIMNQILNPMEMTQKDSLAKELLSIYMSQMTDMDVTEEEARALLELFRFNDQ